MNILNILNNAAQKLSQFALTISAFGLVLMTAIIGWQVFSRYVLDASPAWSESLALLLMLYYILLTAAVGVYEGFHLGLKLLLDSLPDQSARILVTVNNILVLIFGLAMLFNGVHLANFTIDHIIPSLNISRSFAFIPFVMAGALISLFALVQALNAATNRQA